MGCPFVIEIGRPSLVFRTGSYFDPSGRKVEKTAGGKEVGNKSLEIQKRFGGTFHTTALEAFANLYAPPFPLIEKY